MSQVSFAQTGSKPMTYKDFFDAKNLHEEKGQFNIYSGNDKYYLEISKKDLGDNIFVSSHITKGSFSSISGQSGIYYFKLGRNNTLDLYQNKSTTFANDSVDFCMVNAIQKSGLMPVYKSFTVVALGKEKKSYIIDITQELSATNGIFSLSKPGPLTGPDPSRSGVRKYEMIDKGVVFTAVATQSTFGEGQGGRDENFISTYEFQMLLQKMPEHDLVLKKDHDAYGFNAVEHVVYNTENYRADKIQYVKRWCLKTDNNGTKLQKKGIPVEPQIPIKVWIDPLAPEVFTECVKSALNQWETAFEKAGWKNVFRYVKDNNLEYKKINFYWGYAYNENSKFVIEDPVSGEILAANINFMDQSTKDALVNYFLLCGAVDQDIQTNYDGIVLRQRILTSKLSGLIGEVLGLKENFSAVTAFTPKQLRNVEWLKKWGPSASVVGTKLPDYLVQQSDNISADYLWPKVSIYDYDAIEYLYGNKTSSPQLKATYYAEASKADPYVQSGFICEDLITASETGIDNLEKIYPKIHEFVAGRKSYSNASDEISLFIKQTFSLYQFFVNQEAVLVGGKMKRKVIRGKNEVPVRYVSKQMQLDALTALEEHVFKGVPEWMGNKDLMNIQPVNLNKFYVDMTHNVLRNILKKEVLGNLTDAENQLGEKAFTCSDLFHYLDRVVFHNFNPSMQLSTPQMSVELALVEVLINAATENNVSGGVNDLSAAIQVYLIQTKENIEKLIEEEGISDEMRNNAKLMLLRMNRTYFNKTI